MDPPGTEPERNSSGREATRRSCRVYNINRWPAALRQTRFRSLIEAKTNAGLGLLIGWGFNFWAMPFFGFTPSATQAAAITGCYFVLSSLRSYVLRRFFNSFAR